MTFDLEITSDINLCKALWEKYSPKEFITDLWNYRYAFHKAYQSKPHFILVKQGREVMGFVPLEYWPFKKRYQLFGGGDWNEKLRFYIGKQIDRSIIEGLMKFFPQQTDLFFLLYDANLAKYLIKSEKTYFLENIQNIEDLYRDWSGKHIRTLRYQLKKIEKLHPIIKFGEKSVEKMAEFNKLRFGEDSVFTDFGFRESLEILLNDSSLGNYLKTFSIYIDGEIKALVVTSIYNDIVTYLQAGYDHKINNFGKYLNIKIIEFALQFNPKRIDCLTDDSGWKELWHLSHEWLYKLTCG